MLKAKRSIADSVKVAVSNGTLLTATVVVAISIKLVDWINAVGSLIAPTRSHAPSSQCSIQTLSASRGATMARIASFHFSVEHVGMSTRTNSGDSVRTKTAAVSHAK